MKTSRQRPVQSSPVRAFERRFLYAGAVCLGIALPVWLRAMVQPNEVSNADGSQPFHSDRLLVKPEGVAALVQLEQLHRTLGSRVVRSFPQIGGLQIVSLPAGLALPDALAAYQASGLVEYAERDYQLRVLRTPNDTHFQDGSLWGLHNTGQQGGKADGDIDGPEAWEVEVDAESIVVAVIDTGIHTTHEDLQGNLWVNPGETGTGILGLDKSRNGLDDDGNGFIDDVHGIEAILGTGLPFDLNGHGTHVSGTIGAVGNNQTGVAGVAWKVRLMACKFLTALGTGFTSDAITCIDYARENGAHVINASWGGAEFSQALQDAIESVRRAGILFVAAAGNHGGDNDTEPLYPASYQLDNILSVAATTRSDELASFSNFGLDSVDLGAPGRRSCPPGTPPAALIRSWTALPWPLPTSPEPPHCSGRLSRLNPIPRSAGACSPVATRWQGCRERRSAAAA